MFSVCSFCEWSKLCRMSTVGGLRHLADVLHRLVDEWLPLRAVPSLQLEGRDVVRVPVHLAVHHREMFRPVDVVSRRHPFLPDADRSLFPHKNRLANGAGQGTVRRALKHSLRHHQDRNQTEVHHNRAAKLIADAAWALLLQLKKKLANVADRRQRHQKRRHRIRQRTRTVSSRVQIDRAEEEAVNVAHSSVQADTPTNDHERPSIGEGTQVLRNVDSGQVQQDARKFLQTDVAGQVLKSTRGGEVPTGVLGDRVPTANSKCERNLARCHLSHQNGESVTTTETDSSTSPTGRTSEWLQVRRRNAEEGTHLWVQSRQMPVPRQRTVSAVRTKWRPKLQKRSRKVMMQPRRRERKCQAVKRYHYCHVC